MSVVEFEQQVQISGGTSWRFPLGLGIGDIACVLEAFSQRPLKP